MLVRGDRLSKSMSAYLIERIEAHPLIDVHLETQLTELHASGDQLSAVTFADAAGKSETRTVDGVFLCIGGTPHTEWCSREHVITDARGLHPDGAGPGDGRPPSRLLAARARSASARDEPRRALRRGRRPARLDEARRRGRRRGIDGRVAHLQPPGRARCHLLSSRPFSSTRASEPRRCSSRSTTSS